MGAPGPNPDNVDPCLPQARDHPAAGASHLIEVLT
jgi:hypothetical protein